MVGCALLRRVPGEIAEFQRSSFVTVATVLKAVRKGFQDRAGVIIKRAEREAVAVGRMAALAHRDQVESNTDKPAD